MSAMHRFDRAAPRRALITGVDGFTGPYVAAALTDHGFEVHGTTYGGAQGAAHRLDLLDFPACARLVADLRPTHVIHLAAISFVATADLPSLYATNIIGTRNLLRALAEADERPVSVVVASSANIYGNAPDGPIHEETLPRPANDYAISKLAVEQLARIWSTELPVTIARPFNYTGVGQDAHFLVPKIVAAFASGAAELQLGNLDVTRDFTDVRDIASAYAAIADSGLTGTFNLCSGMAYSIRDILAIAERLSGHRLQIRVAPDLQRHSEIKSLRGSNARLRRLLPTWSCRPLTETMAWMLRDARAEQPADGKLTGAVHNLVA